MKKKLIVIVGVILTSIFLMSCEDRSELTAPTSPSPNLGAVNFTNFVTIGNSLTSGYQSGSLYESAQMYAFGNLIAKQVGTKFEMPLITDPGLPSGRMEVKQLTSTGIVIQYNSSSGSPKNLSYGSSYNNLGIPGAFLYDILNATSGSTCFQAINGGGSNDLFNLILRSQGSQYKQAKSLTPTFATVWIGNNDILGHASSGATIPYTPTATFNFLYSSLMDSIAALGIKVVVANIPDVAVTPFFTTVGGQLRLKGTSAVWGIAGTGDTIPMSLTSNYLTLRASDLLLTGKGTSKSNPLPSSVILDAAEALAVKNVTTAYNTTIKTLAEAKGFGFVDINKVFNDIAKFGRSENGIQFSVLYVTGGLFSLDGVHPTSRGSGIIANEFIKVINAKWGTSIPLVNVSQIPGSLILAKMGPMGLPIFEKGTLDNLLF